ncbi:RRXRR domain-containing protein [Methylovulum miyakonense]|uniref:RRXRR domain-containing protein n=1 Tax=Methylovulum miyakonense TaxID=645578 RepID=UPI0003A08A46|nr:RRXRR domain-containing protein [Methylovulum miyakonense]
MAVQVVASDGQLLNPCHPARARELIRKQRAICIGRQPYTIRLLPPHSDDAETVPSQQDYS